MEASVKLGRILGIPVGLHTSWFLVFGLVTWSLAVGYFPAEHPSLPAVAYWGLGAVTSLLFFGSVLVHELSHSVVALRHEMPVQGITLFIFGGVAQIGREPPDAHAEFRIAIAGPLASLVLGIGFGALWWLDQAVPYLAAPSLWLMRINLLLAAFNMIPGFPLDGGRVLRAIVWHFTGNFHKATRVATFAGQLTAFGFIGVGLLIMLSGNFFNGLALFAAPELFRTYRLPLDLREQLIVAQRLHVKPLLTLFTGDGHFFILALSQNQVRLLEATRYEVDEIELEGVPSSMAEALPSDRAEKQLQFQTRTRGGKGERAAVFHGHDPADEAKRQILRYFQRVDEGLRKVLREEQAPLVLVGVDYLLPLYREANSYPHLLAEGITGSPETIKAADLHEQAWAIVEPHFAAAQHQALADYAQKAGTGLTSNRVDEVVPAAYHGRISLLWVALGAEVWGRYDPEAGIIDRRDEPVPGDEDLLDLAALQTILKGGTVYAVEPKAVAGSGSLAALFRY
jgi:Zn-dependent protease